ncbi:MAG: fumarate hydratase [Coriobacteriia bacterium]|nr:fumarate hydratase [Coriobacteriia bacterium]
MSTPCYIPTFDAATLASTVAAATNQVAQELRPDVRLAMHRALQAESNERGRQALGMLIDNAHIAEADRVPLCQDTGSVWVLLEIGRLPSGASLNIPANIFSQVDAAIRWVWQDARLRTSMLQDALLDRTNTFDNTPAFCELAFNDAISGVRLSVMLKGGGSDNASRLTMLAPGDGWQAISDFVVETVAAKGANACPPLVIGVGIGATFDKVASLAKRALLRPLDTVNTDQTLAAYEKELVDKINALEIGAGAMGGDTTALAVNIITSACHMASLPLAVNVGCSAMRSVTYSLVGEWLS